MTPSSHPPRVAWIAATLLLAHFTACAGSPSTCEGEACGDAGAAVGDVDAGDSGQTTEDAGERDAGEGDGGEVDAGEVDAGEVDAGEIDAGVVDAGVVDAGTAPGTCGDPIPLVIDPDGAITVSGTTGGAQSNLTDSRCLSSGPELVYSFTLTDPRAFRASVRPVVENDFRPTLQLRGTPCATNRRDCAMYSSSGQTDLAVSPLDPGTWYLVVDSDGGEGLFMLDVEFSAALPKGGDECAAPYRTSLGGNAIGNQESGADLAGFANDNATAGCDGTGPDLVYKLNLTETRKVSISLAARASPTYRPVLYLQRGSCSLQGSNECNAAPSAGGTAALSNLLLPPGTYYIWLDGHSGTTGSYTFKYSLAAP